MTPKLIAAALCLTSLVAGCSQQTINSAQNDAQHNLAVVKPQLDKLSLQARVTAALTAANLPTTIHVRADANGVYLRGNVKTAQEKIRAGQIARDTLGSGKKVDNQLQVAP